MHIHFIGIGGIGVSALARYFRFKNIPVSGSDVQPSEITEALEREGVAIAYGLHKRSNVPKQATHVIYTPAVADKNPEVQAARARKLVLQSYPKALGELTRRMTTVTVSGSHGKSTTTALAALVLAEGYFDPTVIVGTKLKEFGNTNFRGGMSKYLLIEADEWNRSFLNYSPTIAVITNIDVEHLDTYKNAAGVERAFREYVERVPADGAIVANADDERTRRIVEDFGDRVRWFSLRDTAATAVRRVLRIPGEHNVSNALAAYTLGRTLGVPEAAILTGLSHFGGAWRRFEFLGVHGGAFYFTDYGHHPREIAATLEAARGRFPFRRIWCVFQPHQYERLKHLWTDFTGAFDAADRVAFVPVYAVTGRERSKTDSMVGSDRLAAAVAARGKQAAFLPSQAAAKAFLGDEVRAGDVVIIMGAGDIYNLAKEFAGAVS